MNSSKKRRAILLLLAMLGGLTGCKVKESKIDEKTEVSIELINEAEVPIDTPIITELPTIATVTPTMAPTPIPTVEAHVGNLKTCSEYKTINKNNVNMRLDANTNSLKLGQLNKGDMCTCIAEYKDWSLVMTGNTICFIKSEFLDSDLKYDSPYTYEENFDIVYANSGINFRLSPEVTDTNKILLIPKGSEIEVFGKTNNGWYLAKYNGQIGYVCAEYTRSLKSKIQAIYPNIKDLKVTGIGSLKKDTSLYQESSSSSNILKNLEIYESVEFLSENNGYYFAKVGENVGYINKKDVKKLTDISILVDLSEQRLKIYYHDDVIMDTLVSTGKSSSPTPTGLYKIESKTPGRYLTGPDYKAWVNYWMKINGSIGVHDMEGRKMGKPKSHGCISMTLNDAEFTYNHCPEGTSVNVQR